MPNQPQIHVLIAAAGTGTRYDETQSDIPKQYQRFHGKSIIRHSIDKFLNIKRITSITCLINEAHQKLYNDAIMGIDINAPIVGSDNRKNSVYNGLRNLFHVKHEDVILIHDAARPLVHCTDTDALIDTALKTKAASLAQKIPDTLYDSAQNQTLNREDIWSIQTPQAFEYALIMKAHEHFKDDNSFTDDRGMIEAIGHKVELIESQHPNFKITTKADFTMAEKLAQPSQKTIMATGYDVHAFEDAPAPDKLIKLGGIDIPHSHKLKGHSDADVVLHTITDALLGSINDGDIGTHFPPSDPKWKGADSALFLSEAVNKLNNINALIDFIDITIQAELPKIGPHRAAMQKRISDITGVSINDISIKATTTEGLGFVGRKEGIACQCAVTITRDVA